MINLFFKSLICAFIFLGLNTINAQSISEKIYQLEIIARNTQEKKDAKRLIEEANLLANTLFEQKGQFSKNSNNLCHSEDEFSKMVLKLMHIKQYARGIARVQVAKQRALTTNLDIIVYELSGSYSKNVPNSAYCINVGSLPQGIYIVNASNEGKNFSQKFLKE